MTNSQQGDYKIEPEYLGPLGDRPLAETAKSASPEDLFPGAAAFLRPRHQRRRRAQWAAAGPLLKRLLQPNEHVLYVAHGMQMPPALHLIALGAMAMPYHQVVLVITDARLIEVMMDVRGKRAGTRLRSFPWSGVRGLKVSLGKLTLQPASGRKQAWKLPLRGDRRIIDLLLARLRPRLLQEGAGRAEPLPLWHCPQCGHALAAKPISCTHCRTTFRSSRLAAMLALAFPGAGLFYAGHPFLAAMDFFGEVVLYALFLLLAVEAEPGSVGVAIGLGAFFFVMTKLESVHLSSILVARTKPEAPSAQSNYRKVVLVGGLASLILIGGAFPLVGAARPVIDQDLDAAGPDNPWQVSRDRAEWDDFADDPTARSRWTHPSGLRVTLFAYPQGILDGVDDFRNDYRRQMGDQGPTFTMDDDVPAPFQGFRSVSRRKDGAGTPVALVHYFVMDGEHHDIHQLAATVLEEDAVLVDELMRDLLSRARWIDAAPPVTAGAVR
jgi:hypothetical protein